MQVHLRKCFTVTVGALAAVATMATGGISAANASEDIANPNSAIGYPSFHGDQNPIPDSGVQYDAANSYLGKVFDRDVSQGAGTDTADSHDFWVDRMLVRKGDQPTGTGTTDKGTYQYEGSDGNQYMFSRGRAAYMRTHEPGTFGFGGQLAYKDTISDKGGFSVNLSEGGMKLTLKEDGSQRKQTPSYWQSVFTTSDPSLKLTEIKYITNENVLVMGYNLKSSVAKTVTVDVDSLIAINADGDELTGVVNLNRQLTTVYPRLSGDSMKLVDGKLHGDVALTANQPVYNKIQMGLLADELPSAKTEYDQVRGQSAAQAYKDHVTTYNKWWVDNIPYIQTPEQNIDKTVFYRWWLTRFNFIDANMPGNTYQFPAAIEGVLGYNNSIVLTTCMFLNDLKYLRDPSYSYGTWVAAGETAKSKQYVDNPGGTSWNNSYTQYITDSAWQSYMIHGGPKDIAESIGTYGRNDVNGLVGSQNKSFNRNGNKLIDWDWASMTGNDADAVSFDEHPGEAMDRPESAWVWANARSAADAFKEAGDTSGASEMKQTADDIRSQIIDELWNNDTKLVQSKWVGTYNGQFAKWKEINNFYPYAAELMPTDGTYDKGLRLFADADQYPIFPFFTANQADKAEMIKETGKEGSNNFSIINSTPLFRIYASGLRSYNSEANGYITPESFKKLLYWNAFAHYQGGDNRYPDQNEFWNTATDKNGGEIDYRSWIHHTQLGTTNWTMVEDVAGLRPRSDGKIELDPIAIPGWNYFTVNNLSYHGQDVSIVWNAKDKDGKLHYTNLPEGYSLYVSGKRVFTSDKLTHVIYDSATGQASVSDANGDQSANIVSGDAQSLQDADAVQYGSDSRVTDIFAKAGKNIDPASESQIDVAKGASVSASYEADGRPATAAVDGSTVNEPFWGTDGSKNAKDSLTIDFGAAKTIDNIRLYFYKTAASFTVQGYSEPSLYQLEYWDGGAWKRIPAQYRTPDIPKANYNNVQFPEITTNKIRAVFTHAPGYKTGVKEIEAYDTGIAAPEAQNKAPVVDAYVAKNSAEGAQLAGTVRDDGLPDGELNAKWEMVSGPKGGKVVFADATSASTVATFNIEGDYVLKLTGSDGELSAEKSVTVHGIPSDGTVNIASQAKPTVSSINATLPKDNAKVINDGQSDPAGSSAKMSWNNWGQNDAAPWVQYEWAGKVPLAKANVYFWTDGGGVPLPKSWKLQYWDDSSNGWKDVSLKSGSSYDVAKGQGETVSFKTVWTSKLRVAMTPDGGNAVGLSEVEAYAKEPQSVEDVARMVATGSKAEDLKLPSTVSASYADGSRADLAVTWPEVSDAQLASDGSFTLKGVVTGAPAGVTAVVNVKSDANSALANGVSSIDDSEQTVYQGSTGFTPPATVTGRYMNGGSDSSLKVAWDAAQLNAVKLDTVGDYQVTGSVAGTSKTAKLVIHVIANPNAPDTTPLTGWIQSKAKTSVSAEASWSKAENKLNDGVLIDDTWPTQDDQDVNAKVWGTWGVATDGIYAQYTWDKDAVIDKAQVQFWANFSTRNEAQGGLEIPDGWEVQYWDNASSAWKQVSGGKYTTVRNDPTHHATENGGWSVATFSPVTTSKLRLVLHPNLTRSATFGTAVAELQVHAQDGTPVAVNTAALRSAVNAAGSLQKNRYTSQSWAPFEQALNEAKALLANSAATQQQVDQALQKLHDVQLALVPITPMPSANVTELNKLIAAVSGLKEAAYTKNSWKVFAQALQSAKSVAASNSATQQEVDAALRELQNAKNGLKAAPSLPGKTDASRLLEAVNKASGLKQADYTASSWSRFARALAQAQSVLTNSASTQQQIDAALHQLNDAVNALKPANGVIPGNGGNPGVIGGPGHGGAPGVIGGPGNGGAPTVIGQPGNGGTALGGGHAADSAHQKQPGKVGALSMTGIDGTVVLIALTVALLAFGGVLELSRRRGCHTAC